jgi:hypothetical protein
MLFNRVFCHTARTRRNDQVERKGVNTRFQGGHIGGRATYNCFGRDKTDDDKRKKSKRPPCPYTEKMKKMITGPKSSQGKRRDKTDTVRKLRK